MHLDTVFTMVDRDKFTVHPNILSSITVYVMELDENRTMKIEQEDGRLEDILKAHDKAILEGEEGFHRLMHYDAILQLSAIFG